MSRIMNRIRGRWSRLLKSLALIATGLLAAASAVVIVTSPANAVDGGDIAIIRTLSTECAQSDSADGQATIRIQDGRNTPGDPAIAYDILIDGTAWSGSPLSLTGGEARVITVTGLSAGSHTASGALNSATLASTDFTIDACAPANQPPVATSSSVTTTSGAAVDTPLSATDPDGDALSYSVVSDPSHGSLSGSGANLVYTPVAGYSGSDSFTWQATDNKGAVSNAAIVSITVNAAPLVVTAVPTAPVQTVVNGPNNDVLMPPTLTGVVYDCTAWVNGTATCTAKAADGYVLPEGVTTEWSYTDSNTGGVVTPPDFPAAPKVCGPNYRLPDDTADFTWVISNKPGEEGHVIATRVADGATHDYGKVPLGDCPTSPANPGDHGNPPDDGGGVVSNPLPAPALSLNPTAPQSSVQEELESPITGSGPSRLGGHGDTSDGVANGIVAGGFGVLAVLLGVGGFFLIRRRHA